MTTQVTIQELAALLATSEEAIERRCQRGELEHVTENDRVLIPLSAVNITMLRRTYGEGGRKILVSISEENLETMQGLVPTGRGKGLGGPVIELSLEFLLSLVGEGDSDVAERLALFSQINGKPISLETLAANLKAASQTVESLNWQLETETA